MTYLESIKKHRRSGFSLIEIMIAIAIIGLLAAVAGPYAYNMYQDARKNRAARDLKGIQQGIELFQVQIGRMPNNINELIKKPRDPKEAFKWAEGGYLGRKKAIPKDPWGKRYVYKREPEGTNPYTLFSRGPGGKQKISVWILD